MRRRASGFTLVELLVVLGLIATLMSLLIPVLAKVRSAANGTACMANLRQLGQGWALYTADHRGHLMPYVFSTPTAPSISWENYWPGSLKKYTIDDRMLVCASANEPTDVPQRRGYGTASQAWTGKFAAPGSGLKVSPTMYRVGSYGFNRYMSAGHGQGLGKSATKLSSLKYLSEVPLFMDCAFSDLQPDNGTAAAPVDLPPTVTGEDVKPGVPEHWKVLIARHGRAINVCMADGSVQRIALNDIYEMRWSTGWEKYKLSLPLN